MTDPEMDSIFSFLFFSFVLFCFLFFFSFLVITTLDALDIMHLKVRQGTSNKS